MSGECSRPAGLLEECSARGISLTAAGKDRIAIDAPRDCPFGEGFQPAFKIAGLPVLGQEILVGEIFGQRAARVFHIPEIG